MTYYYEHSVVYLDYTGEEDIGNTSSLITIVASTMIIHTVLYSISDLQCLPSRIVRHDILHLGEFNLHDQPQSNASIVYI